MVLIDLLSIISDYENVNIYNSDYDLLSFYDGRNSIDEIYNNRMVDLVHAISENTINIFIR